MPYELLTLGELFDVTSGGTPSRSNPAYFEDGSIPWVKTGDLKEKYIYGAEEKITELAIAKSAAKIFPENTVLLAMYGATIGACSILKTKAASNQACAAFLPTPKVLPEFLYYYLLSQKDTFVNDGVGGAQPNISGAYLKRFKIPLPPLETQKNIARVLEQADQLRKHAQQMETELNQLAQSLFLEMFGDPVTNPKGWQIKTPLDCCEEIVDCVNRTAKTVDYVTPYKMVRTTNIRYGELSLKDVRYVEKEVFDTWVRRLKPKRGDVLFTREAPAGEATVIEVDDELFLGQRIMHYRPDSKKVTSHFLKFELMESRVKRQIDRLSSGSTVVHLSVEDCKEFSIRLPPMAVQLKFDNAIQRLNEQKKVCRMSISKMDNLFESLMQRAFKGELTAKAA